jgi:hypothetical protein
MMINYIELFLLDNKMSLPDNVQFCVDYKSLKRIIQNFKTDATRINYSKI